MAATLRWFTALLDPDPFTQGGMHALPRSILAPGAEIAPDGGPCREVVRQRSPLASGAIYLEYGVEHLAHVRCSRAPASFGWRDQWFQDGPLLVGQVAGVPSG